MKKYIAFRLKLCIMNISEIFIITGGAEMDNQSRSLTYRIESKPGASKRRLKEMILYISGKCRENETFGATKLNKILFHSDFGSYGMRGKPITGEVYQKLPKGPAPLLLLPIRDEMIEDGDIKYEPRPYHNKTQQVIVPNRDPDLSEFDESDLLFVNSVIKDLWNENATEVSAKSHGVTWHLCDEGDRIPYESAFLAEPKATPTHKQRALELSKIYGW